MKYHWTLEKDHSWVLRQPNQGARAVIKHREDDWGYCAHLLEPGFPGTGPHKSADTCARWVRVVMRAKIDPEAEFGEFPRDRWRNPHAKPRCAKPNNPQVAALP